MRETAKTRLDKAAERLPAWMGAVAVAGTLAALADGHSEWAAGFAVGSVTAILAYWWLHRAVAAALAPGDGRPAGGTMTKLVIRYPLAFGVIALFYFTGWLPLGAVIAGLFVPLAGALVECVVLAVSLIRAPAEPVEAELTPGEYGPSVPH